MRIVELKTDHLKDNRNVGHGRPVFGWRVEGAERDIFQVSYRIWVWREDVSGRTLGRRFAVWDSGVVVSSCMSIVYGGEGLASDSRYWWRVECKLSYEGGEVRAGEDGWFETGLFEREEWKGCFIGETQDQVYHLYRKGFGCGGAVRRAKLYVCGLGHFECWINGERVSDHVLEPGWSDYDKTCFYTAYDVSDLVKEGNNGLLVKLGDGMFHVPGGRYVYFPRSYGRSKLLVQLEIVFADGSCERVVTDSSWKMLPGPVRFCCIYGGEDYDARLWKEEYLSGEYMEDASWEPVVCVKPPRGKLTAMPMEPLKVMKIYEPVCVRRTAPGVWLYDLGTNLSGWARIRITTPGLSAGEKVVLTPGEILDEYGRVSGKVTGEGYAWTYILNGEKEQEFAPDFTYTGFRYVEVTGALPREGGAYDSGLPVIESLTGEFIYPDVEQAGDFQCSNELFGGIHQIVKQAILSNTKSYFTDCPHREKLGWLEQTHLIGPSVMYNLDVHNLYGKVERDMADAQWENGLVPDVCPEYVTGFGKWHQGFVDSPEWGSACILNPWLVYKRFGDKALLERSYETMKRYMDYLTCRTHHEVLHHGLGDWLDIGPCPPHSQNTPVPVVATCIYYYDLQVMKETARLLCRERDAAQYGALMERVFAEYNLQFLDDQTGRYGNGSQTAQAMSLVTGLVPHRMEEKAVGVLRADIRKRNGSITAGDIGHPFLVAALMKYGLEELLSDMTNRTETPGYGYQVVNGATTLTEEWDGPQPGHPHGSQNHLMLGSIEEWFYAGLGGMDLIRAQLPFGEVRIAPHPVMGVDWVKAWTKHPCGRISVEWRREGGRITADVEVPPNVTAHLEGPDGCVKRVGSGLHRYQFSV